MPLSVHQANDCQPDIDQKIVWDSHSATLQAVPLVPGRYYPEGGGGDYCNSANIGGFHGPVSVNWDCYCHEDEYMSRPFQQIRSPQAGGNRTA